MRGFSSLMLASHLAVLGLVFPLNSPARRLVTENVGAQITPEDLTVDLTLENLGEEYQVIPSTEPHGGRSASQLTLKVGIHLQNTSAEYVMSLDPGCLRVVKKVVFPEPLVGPIQEPIDIFESPEPLTPCASGWPPRKVIRVMPGESYEITEQLKFKIADKFSADFSESISPGVYYLQLTMAFARSWGTGKQTNTVWFEGAMQAPLMKFKVSGKPKRRQT